MPELPEVETIRQGLEEGFLNLRLEGVEVCDRRLLQNCSLVDLGKLRGRRLKRVARRGKFLILQFGDHALVIHPRMTGKLLPWEGHYTRMILQFEAGRRLVLDDLRRFASLHCARADELDKIVPLRRLGIEPFTPGYSWANFSKLLRTPQEIKRLLLDQGKVAGLGNIYANEALFRARIHPERQANSLSAEEARSLFEEIPSLLEEALLSQGTTLSTYRTASGDSGEFQRLLQIYGREGEPCRRCETPIEKITQGGRSSYFCPKCQI